MNYFLFAAAVLLFLYKKAPMIGVEPMVDTIRRPC